MKKILTIAHNTFKEILRDRILYGILVFALFLVGLSLALGQLSFNEQARISVNMGFFGMHFSAIIVTIFIGCSLVFKEIDKKTILTILPRSITRSQFLIGKFLGLYAVLIVIITGLGIVLAGLCFMLDFPLNITFIQAIAGILFEALILLALTLLFSSFSRPSMTVVFGLSCFLVGHGIKSLKFFADKSESELFKVFSGVVSKIIPNLEYFNWRSMPLYSEQIKLSEFLSAGVYSLSYAVVFMGIAVLIFKRRDFV